MSSRAMTELHTCKHSWVHSKSYHCVHSGCPLMGPALSCCPQLPPLPIIPTVFTPSLIYMTDLPTCPQSFELVTSALQVLGWKGTGLRYGSEVAGPESSQCEFQSGFCPRSVPACLQDTLTSPYTYPQVAWRLPGPWDRENGLKGTEALEDPSVSWGDMT